MIISLLVAFWRWMRPFQWYLLWFGHSKFIIGVSGVILNNENQVLLLRHRFWEAGTWGLVGGNVNSGERLEDALARELREETGYRIKHPILLRLKSGYKLRMEASYLARLNEGTPRLDPVEIIEARFFDLDALPEGLISSHKEIVELARQRLKAKDAKWLLDGGSAEKPSRTLATDHIAA